MTSVSDGARILTGDDSLTFQRDGFLVVRNVFSSHEVDELREAIAREGRTAASIGRILEPKAGEVVPVGDLLGRERLRDLVFDGRLIDIARSLLGRSEIVYFGDSGLMVGGHGRGFHKDNTVRDSSAHADWRSAYTLIRMGIYLQDHDRYSGGLKVRRGSHLHPDVASGAIVDIDTRPGDIVVWSLRTTHSGHTVRVRGLRSVHLQPRFEGRLPSFLCVEEPCERLAAFITYGVDDHHLRAYIEKHTDLTTYPNNYLYNAWLYSYGGEDVIRLAESKGCRFLRPIADYGSLHTSKQSHAGGFIPVGEARADQYPAFGAELWIRRTGKLVRGVTKFLRRPPSG